MTKKVRETVYVSYLTSRRGVTNIQVSSTWKKASNRCRRALDLIDWTRGTSGHVIAALVE